MKKNNTEGKVRDVDTYIATAPKETRAKLSELRYIIIRAAPKAVEGISYDMPYYKYHGPIAGFAAYRNHIGFFGALPDEYKEELKAYETSKGTIRFSLDKPLPSSLIRKLVKARIKRNEARGKNRI